MRDVEGLVCPKCGGVKIILETWKSPRFYSSYDLDKILEKWGMNCVKKLHCEDCKFIWDAKTEKEMSA